MSHYFTVRYSQANGNPINEILTPLQYINKFCCVVHQQC